MMMGACESFSGPDDTLAGDASTDTGTTETSTTNDAGTPDAQARGGTQLALGQEHSCALLASGSVRCWGNFTRLGVALRQAPPQEFRAESVSFGNDAGPEPRIAQIAAGVAHTCAVSVAGELFCWGANGEGQLTGAAPLQAQVPFRIEVPKNFNGWRNVTAGPYHTCAVASRASGDARPFCWGRNSNGESNPLTTLPQSGPAEIASAPGDIVAIAAGDAVSCALGKAGRAFCWGSTLGGRLGDGRTLGEHDTVTVLDPQGQPLEGISRIWAGGSSACAQTSAGPTYCWGSLARGFGGANPRPTPLTAGGTVRSMSLAVLNDHGAVVDTTGAAFQWGTVYLGAAFVGAPSPTNVLPPGQAPYTWALGPDHMCLALRSDPTAAGSFHCLGRNSSRQLGSSVQSGDTDQLVQVFDLADPPSP